MRCAVFYTPSSARSQPVSFFTRQPSCWRQTTRADVIITVMTTAPPSENKQLLSWTNCKVWLWLKITRRRVIDIQSQSRIVSISKSCWHLEKMVNLGGVKVVKFYDLSEFCWIIHSFCSVYLLLSIFARARGVRTTHACWRRPSHRHHHLKHTINSN